MDFKPLEATVVLPQLNEGNHTLTVTAREPDVIRKTGYYTFKDKVDFVVAPLPPTIINLSIKNETYKQNSLNLNFTTNQPTSWMAYSIDGKQNVTITGNTTIPDLSNGFHNITIYAADMSGTIGSSETITFKVALPFPTTTVAVVSGVLGALVVAGLLVFLKRRKR